MVPRASRLLSKELFYLLTLVRHVPRLTGQLVNYREALNFPLTTSRSWDSIIIWR
jgi:hypothetical protein